MAKAITLIESSREADREAAQGLLEQLLPHTGNSVRIGVSGVPGVGKSTFIEALGLELLRHGKKLAVLAVDPSSPLTGGSILGDKTRMVELSRQADSFIRPSASAGSLGGVAQKTREGILLCEAAGFDVILVETVGVGQSEFEVANMVDIFLLLMVPNAGDELQGIKKGIMELVDLLVINKADGKSLELAKQSQSHYQSAFAMLQHASFWTPRVLLCSALERQLIPDIWQAIQDYLDASRQAGHFEQRRDRQRLDWMHKLVYEHFEQRFSRDERLGALRQALQGAVLRQEMTVFTAAQRLIAEV